VVPTTGPEKTRQQIAEMVTMEKVVAVTAAETAYQRGCWFISSISEIRIMWNITMSVFLGAL
jgi:hypothetical protein